MENWILISILVAISVLAVNSHTIVYPGKSALLSYSPARGEFPVESLFGRGFFSYIDNHGISRTINLEPNPLLGVRVNNDGKLSTDSGVSLSGSPKEDRLKPIKEFDERPFQDNLEQEMGSAPSLESDVSKLNAVSQQTNVDQKFNEQILSVSVPKQQEQIILYPESGTVLSQGSGLQPDGNTFYTTQNIPNVAFPNSPITSRPSSVPGVFTLKNPFLVQQLDHPAQNPSTGNPAAVRQNVISSNPSGSGQLIFYPPTGSTNAAAIPIVPNQIFLFPQKATNSSSNQGFPYDFSKLASSGSEAVISQGGQEQTDAIPPMVNFPVSSQPTAIFQQVPIQDINQASQDPVFSSPSSTLPGLETKLSPEPLVASINQASPKLETPMTGVFLGGNPFFPPSRFPLTPSAQGGLLVQPGNPFLSINNKEKPLSLPKPQTTTTTSAPIFNADQKNPFLTNLLGTDVNPGIPSIPVQSTAVEPNNPPQLETSKPVSISCDYNSVGPAASSPEQIKDTPEVEKAKREHFRAHQLALEQLAQARQNNDNDDKNNQENESSLTSALNSSPPLYLTANNAPLDQPVTSGPTMIFEQTTNKVNSVESEISTTQALPL